MRAVESFFCLTFPLNIMCEYIRTCTYYSSVLKCAVYVLMSVQVFTIHGEPFLIGASLCAFGFFALPLIPACMELGVEITYPVAEATSSGLLWSVA